MSGRAGRPQFDDSGVVVIMTRRDTVSAQIRFHSSCFRFTYWVTWMKNDVTLSFDEIHSSSSPLPLEFANRPQIVWMLCMLCTQHPLPTFRSSGLKIYLPCQGSNWYWCTGTSVWEFAIWLGTCWISVSYAYMTFFQWTATGPLSFLCNCEFWSFIPLRVLTLCVRRLLDSIVEHLNAEIVLLTISDCGQAIDWLKCSYLYVRIKKVRSSARLVN